MNEVNGETAFQVRGQLVTASSGQVAHIVQRFYGCQFTQPLLQLIGHSRTEFPPHFLGRIAEFFEFSIAERNFQYRTSAINSLLFR
jgi:hypothetical protein